MASYLLPITDREPLIWILRERRTAFPVYRRRDAERLARGDLLLLYTTRGRFHNPTRDRGRVIGVATIKRRVKDLAEPVRFGEKEFPIGVDLAFEALVPKRRGGRTRSACYVAAEDVLESGCLERVSAPSISAV